MPGSWERGGGAMQCLGGARGEEEETRRSAGSDRAGSGRAVGGWRFFGARFFLSLSLWVLEGRRGSVLQGAGAGRMWPCWVWGEAWVALVMGGMGWSGFEGGLRLWSVG